jgi:hypothetical protein
MRDHSKAIKKRFIYAIKCMAKERYPDEREIDIIKSIGLAAPNYYRMVAKDNNYPTLDHCAILCRKYKISTQWLFFGEGSMRVVQKPGERVKIKELLKMAISIAENGHVK